MQTAEKRALVPKRRFPEFLDAGEWEVKSLGGVARLRNGYAFKSSEYVEDGPFQIITIANVQQGNLAIETTKRIAALPSDIQQHQVLRLGDILVSMTGNVGRVCRVTAEGLLLNQRVGKLIPDAIRDAFFYQLLQRDEFRYTMQLKAAGGAQGNLSAGDITEYGFTMPAEPEEQQRIADCLASLDERITLEAEKLDTLKTHNKGLMQQFFPAVGETLPKLRFPEFLDSGEWEIKPFDKLFTIGNGRDYKHLSSGDVPVYGSGGYMLSVDEFLYDGESVCIGRKGTINNPMFLTGKFWTVDTLFYTHSFKDWAAAKTECNT